MGIYQEFKNFRKLKHNKFITESKSIKNANSNKFNRLTHVRYRNNYSFEIINTHLTQ
jgi:hypothetical protein